MEKTVKKWIKSKPLTFSSIGECKRIARVNFNLFNLNLYSLKSPQKKREKNKLNE